MRDTLKFDQQCNVQSQLNGSKLLQCRKCIEMMLKII